MNDYLVYIIKIIQSHIHDRIFHNKINTTKTGPYTAEIGVTSKIGTFTASLHYHDP